MLVGIRTRGQLAGALLLVFAGECVADDAADWLRSFYDNRGLCVSNSSVRNVLLGDDEVVVQLETQNNYHERLARGGSEIVDEWLSLHCPRPLLAYADKLGGRDIVIQIETIPPLSCTAYENRKR